MMTKIVINMEKLYPDAFDLVNMSSEKTVTLFVQRLQTYLNVLFSSH